MQVNSVYLYPIRLEVFTNASVAGWTTERYRQVYNHDLKMYRSVDNRIDLQVRNSDQKHSSYAGTVLIFNLTAREGMDLVVTKEFSAISETQGTARLIVTQADLIDLEPGSYQYSITQETRRALDGTAYVPGNDYKVTSRSPMYFDSQYGAVGTVMVMGDALSNVENSLVVDKFSYTNPKTLGEDTEQFYISSIIDAQAKLTIPQALHTFQFYSTGYSGSITIQGSTRDDAAPSKWVDLLTFTSTNSLEYKNIEGKYNWFRIKHFPTAGTLDKVLYR
jgi:hypothetical protein